MLKKWILGFLSILCLIQVAYSQEITTKSYVEETTSTIITAKYPQGFNKTAIDQELYSFVQERVKQFKNEENADELQPEIEAKNSLNISYKIPYHEKKALSVVFIVSEYHVGDAHPSDSQFSFNFINGNSLALKDLFSDPVYLKHLADIAKTSLATKHLPDKNMIEEGAKPEEKNYDIWYFTPTGLAVVFDAAQVAPRYLGEQVVQIHKADLINFIKPNIAEAIWG